MYLNAKTLTMPVNVGPTDQLVVTSEASNLLFKTIISHVKTWGPQVIPRGFLKLPAGSGGGGEAVNSSMMNMYFEKKIMQDGSWYWNMCIVFFISQYWPLGFFYDRFSNFSRKFYSSKRGYNFMHVKDI